MHNEHQHLHLAANASRPKTRLSVSLAQGDREIEEAKRLRYRIFAGELGARLHTRTPGVDHDIYDPFAST